MKTKKSLAFLLSFCLLISCFMVGVPISAAETEQTTEAQTDYGLMDTADGSAILHCFNWSYNNIKANLKDIAEAGYTAVQTSPVQPPKDYNSSWTDLGGQW